MNTIGKKNILFAFGYFLLTLGLGMYLANKLGAGEAWLESTAHDLLKFAHVHGNLEALLNIVCGFLICRFGGPSQMLAKIASALLLVGIIFHSGMLYLGGLGILAATKLLPLGAISLVAGVALMIPIIAKGLVAEE